MACDATSWPVLPLAPRTRKCIIVVVPGDCWLYECLMSELASRWNSLMLQVSGTFFRYAVLYRSHLECHFRSIYCRRVRYDCPGLQKMLASICNGSALKTTSADAALAAGQHSQLSLPQPTSSWLAFAKGRHCMYQPPRNSGTRVLTTCLQDRSPRSGVATGRYMLREISAPTSKEGISQSSSSSRRPRKNMDVLRAAR